METKLDNKQREPYRRDAHSEQYGMSLPTGKTCGDCFHFKRCQWLISRIAGDEICDWGPSRFIEPSRLKSITEVKKP